MNADMSLLNVSRSELPQSQLYQVYRSPEDDVADACPRIGRLVDRWLQLQEESGPNAPAARRIERRLHDAIKAGPLYDRILSFAGLNLWVDGRTPEGRVEMQESISL
jgi:hypothetical protein